MESLKQFVLDNQLDAGIAFDGDADRCLAVDEKVNWLTVISLWQFVQQI